MRQIVFGAIVLQLLSAVFFVYPAYRLGTWFGLSSEVVWLIAGTVFFKQAVVRILFRHSKGIIIKAVRVAADFILGIAPVLLFSVLAAEFVLGFGWVQPGIAGAGVLAITVLVGAWGVKKAWAPEVVRVPIASSKVEQPLRVVQISDVHIGSRSTRFLERVIARVVELQPDFLCITGDFIDQRNVGEERLAALRTLDCPVFFCTGNHEHYEDTAQILSRLERLDVEVLRGETARFREVQIIGFDDQSDPDFLGRALPAIGLDPKAFTLLLYHRPHGLGHAASNGIDLMLSGHTHNGQIKPFNWLVRMQFKHLSGLYREGDTHLYVNEGTGTWGPVMRLGTRSEITLFEIAQNS
ncbi:MAG: putative MPP superfamily phosphohydrolase [Limisphaerales bacterium]